MELPMSNGSMRHREPKSEIDDTRDFLQGASCTIAALTPGSSTATSPPTPPASARWRRQPRRRPTPTPACCQTHRWSSACASSIHRAAGHCHLRRGAAMVQEAPYMIIRVSSIALFNSRWRIELLDIGGPGVPWELFRGRDPYLTAQCAIGNF
jgi:hypothetical protein